MSLLHTHTHIQTIALPLCLMSIPLSLSLSQCSFPPLSFSLFLNIAFPLSLTLLSPNLAFSLCLISIHLSLLFSLCISVHLYIYYSLSSLSQCPSLPLLHTLSHSTIALPLSPISDPPLSQSSFSPLSYLYSSLSLSQPSVLHTHTQTSLA